MRGHIRKVGWRCDEAIIVRADRSRRFARHVDEMFKMIEDRCAWRRKSWRHSREKVALVDDTNHATTVCNRTGLLIVDVSPVRTNPRKACMTDNGWKMAIMDFEGFHEGPPPCMREVDQDTCRVAAFDKGYPTTGQSLIGLRWAVASTEDRAAQMNKRHPVELLADLSLQDRRVSGQCVPTLE